MTDASEIGRRAGECLGVLIVRVVVLLTATGVVAVGYFGARFVALTWLHLSMTDARSVGICIGALLLGHFLGFGSGWKAGRRARTEEGE